MAQRLDGKTAVVSAAGQGIGRAITETFAAEGADVIACDIDPAKLADLGSHDRIETLTLDVTDAAAIHALFHTRPPLDILVNVAGFVHSGTILDCTDEDWDFSFDLNVKSMFRMIRAALPAMLEGGGGSIINLSSVASSIKGAPNRFVYGASKAAVIGLTKAIAADYITQGIRCNAICPGTVESPSLQDRLRATGNYEQAKRDFIARQPMGRVGTAQEIAALALYLAEDASAFTTGRTHVIDGGWAL
ncbi:MAG: SDR family oxidoreductase [Pseudomonadota bacterium]